MNLVKKSKGGKGKGGGGDDMLKDIEREMKTESKGLDAG